MSCCISRVVAVRSAPARSNLLEKTDFHVLNHKIRSLALSSPYCAAKIKGKMVRFLLGLSNLCIYL